MTSPILLACGPYLDESGFVASIVVLLLIKPLTYFAFIQAFRYRVSRPIPMRFGQAAWLAAARAGLGVGIIGVGAAALYVIDSETLWDFSWIYLYAERILAWWIVGQFGARLRGRRLLGWIISGTMINAAFDFGMVAGIFAGWMWPAGVTLAVAAFIFLLHIVGRRASLKARFRSGSHCLQCNYDLTGNLSGRCPECRRAIEPLAAAA